MSMLKKIALYARVSTSDQHPEAQLHALRSYAKARGLPVVDEYVDHGVSGAKTRRPALDRLMADARRRRFDAIAVVKLDRLGRSLHHLLVVLGEMEALGVDLVSLDDGLDTSTPVGRLFFQIRGAFAEYERELIRERTRAGMEAARRRGKRIGRPTVIDKQAAARIRRLTARGRSTREIAQVLGISKASVVREVQRQRARAAA